MSQQPPFKVIVVGCGPAGLTAAHSLQLAGIDYTVLERRDSIFSNEGASLVLGPQNLRVMQQFQLYDELMSIGSPIQYVESFTKSGSIIGKNSKMQELKKIIGTAPVAFHRAQLLQKLYEGLCDEAKGRIHFSKKVVIVQDIDEGVIVTCSDGSSYRGSVIIGADGVHSSVRRLMRSAIVSVGKSPKDKETPFLARYRCLWCSFPRPSSCSPGYATETQCKDRSIMFLNGRERSWIFLYEKLAKPTRESTKYTRDDLEAMAKSFAEWPISKTLVVDDVYSSSHGEGMADLEEGVLKRWNFGRIALVGDACHKFTPNAGLGFNNGIQDVVVLCNLLHDAHINGRVDRASLTAIFDQYQARRIAKVAGDARISASQTRLHAWANPTYRFFARKIVPSDFTQSILITYLLPNTIKDAYVLDFVKVKEPFVGTMKWKHALIESI